MNAGIPGSGLGVAFYLLLILIMPLQELWHLFLRRRKFCRLLVFTHLFMGIAIIGGILLGSWILSILSFTFLSNEISQSLIVYKESRVGSLSLRMVFGTTMFLAVILGIIDILLFALFRRNQLPIKK